MALKPDVTISIIKNNLYKSGTVQRYYYNENVYRVSKSTDSFKEIMQTGLECIGDVDAYCITEVLMLAAKSLKTISDECLLSVSFVDFVSEIVDGFEVSGSIKKQIYKCIGEKNIHELDEICKSNSIDKIKTNVLKELCMLHGSIDEVLPNVESLLKDHVSEKSFYEFKSIMMSLKADGLSNVFKLDFSLINNLKYYNGIIFNGYINGVTGTILSGGQYNRLMKKFNTSCDAIGFAVYLDVLDRYNVVTNEFDADIAIIYSEEDDVTDLRRIIEKFIVDGNTVVTFRALPYCFKCKKLFKYCDGEVIPFENND